MLQTRLLFEFVIPCTVDEHWFLPKGEVHWQCLE